MALLRSSSEHVAQWNPTNVVQDWPAYCEALRAIRRKMLAATGPNGASFIRCWERRHRGPNRWVPVR